jgi:uncharacterized protein (TIGR03067 family)
MNAHIPLSGVVSLLVAFAPAPFPKPVKGDLAELQGKWALIKPPYRGYVTIEGYRFIYRVRGELGEMVVDSRLRVDGTRTPKRWDVQPPEENWYLGIYRLEGETLTIWRRCPGSDRPTGFDPEQKHGARELILRRIK